jgi:multidrug efflux pump subunit AcrA (membrane-fusion protein)
MFKYISILVALAGVSVAVYAAATQGRDKPPAPAPAAPPSVNPFAHGIAATGAIESASRNIPLGTPEAGLVVEVAAQVGQVVKKGDALLRLDGRLIEAELVRLEAARASSQARLERLKSSPRAEDIPPARARVAEAQSLVDDLQAQVARWDSIADKRAITEDEFARKRAALETAKARMTTAQAELRLVLAGAWKQDVLIAQAELDQTQADINAAKLRLDRLTVRSPIDGTILKRNVEPGQFIGVGGNPSVSGAALVVADLGTLRVRARVDEEDAPLLVDGAAGRARVRGVVAEELDLKMLRIEPLALPKNDLTGLASERVDTRVVEVVFELVSKAKSRLTPGQIVDVFIDAPAR